MSKQVTLLNVHYCLRSAAWEVASLFSLSYLYKQGLSLPAACLVYGGMFLMRLLFLPLACRLCFQKGLQRTLVFGTILFALRYLTLIPIDGINWKIIPFLLLSGIADPMYRLSYNTFFSFLSKEDQRGADLGIRESLMTVLTIIAPVIGGYLLAYNRTMTFFLLGSLTLLALVPLMKISFFQKPLVFKKATKTEKTGMKLIAYSAVFQHTVIVWRLLVFFMVSDSYQQFGLLLGVAGLLQTVGFVLLGRLFDVGNKIALTLFGGAIVVGIQLLRLFYVTDVFGVVLCDFLFAIVHPFTFLSLMRLFYSKVEQSDDPIRFSANAEIGRAGGVVGVMLIAAILTVFEIDLRWILVLNILCCICTLTTVVRYYYKEEKHDVTRRRSFVVRTLEHLFQKNI